jgi:hypothetical protein
VTFIKIRSHRRNFSNFDSVEQKIKFLKIEIFRIQNTGNFNKTTISPINREFYLAKGTEKFILGRYLLSGILLMLLSLRPWGVAARPAILENRGAKSHFCDYFIIRARYLYRSCYRKCRACNSLHFLFFMFFCQINSFVVTACRNQKFLLLFILFHTTTEVEQLGAFFFDVVSPVGIVHDAIEVLFYSF